MRDFLVNIVQRSINREFQMYRLFRITTDLITGIFDTKSWDTPNNDIRSYFDTEYKKDAKSAYEYWRSTQELTYRSN